MMKLGWCKTKLNGSNIDKQTNEASTVKKEYLSFNDLNISENQENSERKEILPDPETNLPSRVWTKLKVQQIFKQIKPLNIHTPIFPEKIRFVCLSDTHSKLSISRPKPGFVIPPGDVILHAGDFTMKGGPLEIETFNAFLGNLSHPRKVVIAGNHDLPFDDSCFEDDHFCDNQLAAYKKLLASKGVKYIKELITNAIYLQDSMVTICGINIYGSPWQPGRFSGWAFGAERGTDLLEKWKLIPNDVDVLITHGPPVGHGDVTKAGLNVGCVELLNTVQKRVKPKYHVFGHIHESYGMTTDGTTHFINASSCSKGYKLENPPIIFDIPLPPGQSKDSLFGPSPEIILGTNMESLEAK